MNVLPSSSSAKLACSCNGSGIRVSVNSLLRLDALVSQRDLSMRVYGVVPLTPCVGVVQFVSNTMKGLRQQPVYGLMVVMVQVIGRLPERGRDAAPSNRLEQYLYDADKDDDVMK